MGILQYFSTRRNVYESPSNIQSRPNEKESVPVESQIESLQELTLLLSYKPAEQLDQNLKTFDENFLSILSELAEKVTAYYETISFVAHNRNIEDARENEDNLTCRLAVFFSDIFFLVGPGLVPTLKKTSIF